MSNIVMRNFVAGKPVFQNSNALSIDFVMVAISGTPTNATDVETVGHVAATYIPLTQKGANNGVATLDAGGKIPAAQLPSSVMEYKGTWDASTNTPSLADGTGDAGDVYKVSVAGSQDLGGGSITFAAGDWVIYNGTVWEKSINSDAVDSVNGLQGAVVLDTDNIDEGTTNLYHTDARAKAAAVADEIVDGVTDVAPSQNAVFDALALKADDSVVVKSVNGQTPIAGAVTVTTANITENTNLYFTDARAKTAAVLNTLAGSETDQAPSVDAVNTALSGKADIGHTHTSSDITDFDTAVDARIDAASADESYTNDNASAVAERQAVYVKSDGHIDLAQADDIATCPELVTFVKDASIANGAAGLCYAPGEVISGFTGLTIGAAYYVDDSVAGGITATPPAASVGNVIKKVGVAISATRLAYWPSESVEVTA